MIKYYSGKFSLWWTHDKGDWSDERDLSDPFGGRLGCSTFCVGRRASGISRISYSNDERSETVSREPWTMDHGPRTKKRATRLTGVSTTSGFPRKNPPSFTQSALRKLFQWPEFLRKTTWKTLFPGLVWKWSRHFVLKIGPTELWSG